MKSTRIGVAVFVAMTGATSVSAQGLGPSPYGSNLGQDTTAPGSKGDRQMQRKTRGKPVHGDAAVSRAASAPKADPSEDPTATQPR